MHRTPSSASRQPDENGGFDGHGVMPQVESTGASTSGDGHQQRGAIDACSGSLPATGLVSKSESGPEEEVAACHSLCRTGDIQRPECQTTCSSHDGMPVPNVNQISDPLLTPSSAVSFVDRALHHGLPEYTVALCGPSLRERFIPCITWQHRYVARADLVCDFAAIGITGVSGIIFFPPGPLRRWLYQPCIYLCLASAAYLIWKVLQLNYHICRILVRQFEVWFLIGNALVFVATALVEEFRVKDGIHFTHSILGYSHALVSICVIAFMDASEHPALVKQFVLLLSIFVFGALLVVRSLYPSQWPGQEFTLSIVGEEQVQQFSTGAIITSALANIVAFSANFLHHLMSDESAMILTCAVKLTPRSQDLPEEVKPASEQNLRCHHRSEGPTLEDNSRIQDVQDETKPTSKDSPVCQDVPNGRPASDQEEMLPMRVAAAKSSPTSQVVTPGPFKQHLPEKLSL